MQVIRNWLLAAGACLIAVVPPALAQPYPNRVITLIAPYAAGGDSDLSGRNLAAAATKFPGQPAVVQNIVGASGVIGSMRVRGAAPDGYTLLLARIGSHGIVPALDTKTPYRWNDFTFLSLIEFNPIVCAVKADAPYKTLKDLLDFLKANHGKLNYATAGAATSQHLTAEVLMRAGGLPGGAAEPIAYKGGGEATAALLGGHVQFICNNLPSMVPHFKAGTLRPLVTTAQERLKEYPEIATGRELGVAAIEQVTGWTALIGPPGLPPEVVAKWVDTFKKLATDPDWLRGNAAIGGVPAIRSPADTEKYIREQNAVFERLGTELGLRK